PTDIAPEDVMDAPDILPCDVMFPFAVIVVVSDTLLSADVSQRCSVVFRYMIPNSRMLIHFR
ncbi:MAG: hypothetical protein ACKPKO_18915, partial [Candidatus Fonsibacter sp.]